MKTFVASFIYTLQTWSLILAMLFSPVKAFAQGSEARQLELPFEASQMQQSQHIQTQSPKLQLIAPTVAIPENQQREKVVTSRNGVQVVQGGDEVPQNLKSSIQTQIIDPETKKEMNLHTFFESNSTAQERQNSSPKSLIRAYADATRNISRAAVETTRKSPHLAKQTLIHFPAEASTFYAAMGILAMAELNNPLRSNAKNPAALEQFIHHSFYDPMGAISFYAFMLVNRQTGHFFQQLGIPGDHSNAQHFRRIKSTFNHLAPQLGMSAGFLAQTLLTEIYHDKEARMCLGRWGITQVNKVVGTKAIPLSADSPELLEACEAAYDRWALKQKIKDLEPLIYSMIATNVLQAYALPFARTIIKSKGGQAVANAIVKTPGVGVVLRPLSLSLKYGPKVIPQGGLVVKIINIVAFIKIQEIVQPWFDATFGTPRKADDIADLTNRFEQKLGEASQRKFELVHFVDRDDQRANDPAELIKKIGAQYQGFRQYQLQHAFMNYQNWQQALAQFQATYVSSYALYDKIVREVKEFKDRGNHNRYQGPNPSLLFLSRESPIYRVGTLMPKRLSGPLKQDILRDTLVRVREYFSHNQKKLNAQQVRVLRYVSLGLESAYRDLSPKELETAIKKANLNPSTLTIEQRQSIAVELRATRVSNALKVLAQVGQRAQNATSIMNRMKNDVLGAWNQVTGELNKLNFNAFMAHIYKTAQGLNYVVTTAGFDHYQRDLGRNTDLIPELAQEHAPNYYQQAFTPSMADYLLASMVCGPRSQGGAKARETQTSIWSKALNIFNFTDSHKDVFVNLSLVEYTPGMGWKFLPPRLVQDSVANANFCGRIPPRAKTYNFETAIHDFVAGRSVQKQSLSLRSYFNVNTGEFKVNNQTHEGFLPLVKYYMNPEFLKSSDNSSAFFNYWVREVEPQAKRAIIEFGKMYRKLVNEDFVPGFVNRKYQEHKGRKIHLGAGLSLREEGTYYIDTLKRLLQSPELSNLLSQYKRNLDLSILMFSTPSNVKKATEIVLSTMNQNSSEPDLSQASSLEILEGLLEEETVGTQFTAQQIEAVRTAADPAAQAATALLLKNMRTNIEAINALIENAPLRPTAKLVAVQIAKNMAQVAGEADGYNGVMRAVNLQGAPEASDLQ